MDNEQLAFVADALLALCEPNGERPYYSEHRMRSKLMVAERRDPVFAAVTMHRPQDRLLAVEWRGVIDQARLTDRQTLVLGMRLEGYSFDEIGRRRGHTKQGAMRIFVQALKKLARACRVYPFRGMSDVYRSEVRRGLRSGRSGKLCARAA